MHDHDSFMPGGAQKLSGLCPIPNYAGREGRQPAATTLPGADVCVVRAKQQTCTHMAEVVRTAQKLPKVDAR